MNANSLKLNYIKNLMMLDLKLLMEPKAKMLKRFFLA